MKTNNLPEEVLVLRFFESGPIEKVEAVFNIVREKMSQRLIGEQPVGEKDNSKNAQRRSQKRSKGEDVPAKSQEQPLSVHENISNEQRRIL